MIEWPRKRLTSPLTVSPLKVTSAAAAREASTRMFWHSPPIGHSLLR